VVAAAGQVQGHRRLAAPEVEDLGGMHNAGEQTEEGRGKVRGARLPSRGSHAMALSVHGEGARSLRVWRRR
jgi:hypothetical protein